MFLINKGVYIVTDEVYEHLIYEGRKHISVASLGERKRDVYYN